MGRGLLKRSENPSHWNVTVTTVQVNLSSVTDLMATYEPPRFNLSHNKYTVRGTVTNAKKTDLAKLDGVKAIVFFHQ